MPQKIFKKAIQAIHGDGFAVQFPTVLDKLQRNCREVKEERLSCIFKKQRVGCMSQVIQAMLQNN